MGQLNQALTGGRAKIIDTTIVPMTVMLLVVVINSFMDTQYRSVEYTSYTYATENDGDLDAYDDKTPTKLYWMDDDNETWYLQAIQQPDDNSVVILANVIHPYAINTAAVFVKTKQEFLYTLSNHGVLGNLTVDPDSGVDGTYKVTIFENQLQHPPSVFKDDTSRRIMVASGPDGPQYPLYLMVHTSSYVVMATNNISEATEFHPDTATFSKQCQP